MGDINFMSRHGIPASAGPLATGVDLLRRGAQSAPSAVSSMSGLTGRALSGRGRVL